MTESRRRRHARDDRIASTSVLASAIPLTFEWDQRKAVTNLRKHGVSFDEAKTVFASGLTATVPDPYHSVLEDRSLAIGPSDRRRILIVVFTEAGEHLRIISARRATRTEREEYESALSGQ